MYSVELYMRVRRTSMVDGMSIRQASRIFGLHRDTIRKMLKYPTPPGYRRSKAPRRPKIGPYTGVIRDNNFCRPVASSKNVTESLQLLIVAHRCDVT